MHPEFSHRLSLSYGRGRASPADWDIIVVGGGNAGIPTAIAAANGGAKVLLLEKMAFLGGTLLVAGGQMSAANSKLQLAAGFKDSPEQHYADVMRLGGYRANPRLLKLQTENAGWTIDWLADLGVKFDKNRPVYMDHHELYSVARSYQPIGSGAAVAKVLIAELNKCVARGDVEVRLETRATELIQDDQGAVVGVRAVGKDGLSWFRQSTLFWQPVSANRGFGPLTEAREDLCHTCLRRGRPGCHSHRSRSPTWTASPCRGIGSDNPVGLCLYAEAAPATAGYVWVNKLGHALSTGHFKSR